MVSFFARRTLDADASVDLVAETFATALARRRQFRGTTDAEGGAWLYGIARRQLADWYRRGDVERRMLGRLGVERRALTDPEYERIEELGEGREQRARIAAEMDRLAAPQRTALQLRVLEGQSYPEVARALGTSEANARQRVSRALRELAACLEQAGDRVEAHHG
jgi:RNA polymerase sigma-70 factor (ECF subfamily)